MNRLPSNEKIKELWFGFAKEENTSNFKEEHLNLFSDYVWSVMETMEEEDASNEECEALANLCDAIDGWCFTFGSLEGMGIVKSARIVEQVEEWTLEELASNFNEMCNEDNSFGSCDESVLLKDGKIIHEYAYYGYTLNGDV